MPPRFKVELDNEKLVEQEQHLEHGGMLVPVPEAPPEPMTEVLLEVLTPAGNAELPARVVSVLPGVGVGLTFDDAEMARRRLRPVIERARRGGGPGDGNLQVRIQRMTTVEKQELAMTGDRMARMLLWKDPNKAIHPFVLRNRHLTSDEVRMMASYRNINPNALQKISENREWMRDQRIVSALVTNPKTPPQVAVRLVDRLSSAELRRLSRSSDAPRAVQRAARQKLHK